MKSISHYLAQNETISWRGNPNFLVWTLKKILIPSIILIPLTTLVLLGLFNKAFVLFVFLPFLLFFDFFLLWEYFLIFSKKGYPRYYITSQKRILILAELGGLKSPFSSYEGVFSLENIRSTLTTQNIFEKVFGTDCKTIVFYLGFQTTIKQSLIQSDLSGNTKPQFDIKLMGDADQQTQTIAYSQGGVNAQNIIFDSVESPEVILNLLNKQTAPADKTQVTLTKSSFKGLLFYGIIKDCIRLCKIIVYTLIMLLFLGAMIYILAPKGVFIKIVEFYLPKISLIILFIFLLTTSILKVLARLISPQYEIVGNCLIIKPRRFRIISDPPQEKIDLSRIKRIWRVRNFIDGSNTNSFMLAIQLADIYTGKYSIKTNTNLISKLLKMGSGGLTYRVLCSIPRGDEFIRQFGGVEITEGFEGSFFERLVFYSFFI
jgi:hypothetical protein